MILATQQESKPAISAGEARRSEKSLAAD